MQSETRMDGLFQNVDCIELYVSDLDEGIACYRDGLGLKLLWRNDTSAGLGMAQDVTEIVLQTERKQVLVDIKVASVDEAIPCITAAGGRVEIGPFDVDIGRCAVIRDRWENRFAILDMTKGRYMTDESGNVTGITKDETRGDTSTLVM